MKRSENSGTRVSRVYAYGTVPDRIAPVINEDKALGQMRMAQALWNKAVEIERSRVLKYREVMNDADQLRIDELRAKLDDLKLEAKNRRTAARKRKGVDVSDIDAQIKPLLEELTALIAQRKETKDARHSARKEQLDEVNAQAAHALKRARQESAAAGLFWGTYNDILQRVDTGKKNGGELRFRSFRGEGTLTAQIIGGTSPAACIGAPHTFFQIDAQQPDKKWRYARIRIGSDENRKPIWVGIPIVYHREIPPDAEIKSVSVTRRIVAGKVRWQLNVTLNLPAPEVRKGDGIVAIDLGWRLLPSGDGVRVAYWGDSEGAYGQVVVAQSDIDLIKKVASLRAICDRSRDEILPSICSWLGERELGDVWKERTAYLIRWRSCDRLANLIRWWSDNRLTGDDEIFEAARAWRKQYLHLSNWWRNLQEQMALRIREQYRVFASKIAQRYDAVVIEEFDIRKLITDDDPAVCGTYRQMVSPGTFRRVLTNACQREGVRVIKASAYMSTRKCYNCGHTGEWDQIEELVHHCVACDKVYDQDYGAVQNLLQGVVGTTAAA